MTREEIMDTSKEGNVLKVKLGKRIIYIALMSFLDHKVLGYQVDKEGTVRYSKWASKYHYEVRYDQIIELLPIYADED